MSRAATSTGTVRTRPATPTRAPAPRRPGRSPGFYRRAGIVALTVLLLAAGTWVVWVSPVFGVQTVRIEGTAVLRESTVRSTADITPGTPLARVDLAGVEKKVSTLAPVADVRVSRSWPNTVVVRVVERTPVVTVQLAGVRWVVDRTGTPYLPVVDLPGNALPAGVVPLTTATPGPADPPTLAALAVLKSLPAPITQLVASIEAQSAVKVILRLADGRSVVWGAPDAAVQKARLVPVLLGQPGTVFDVSVPSAVVIR